MIYNRISSKKWKTFDFFRFGISIFVGSWNCLQKIDKFPLILVRSVNAENDGTSAKILQFSLEIGSLDAHDSLVFRDVFLKKFGQRQCFSPPTVKGSKTKKNLYKMGKKVITQRRNAWENERLQCIWISALQNFWRMSGLIYIPFDSKAVSCIRF